MDFVIRANSKKRIKTTFNQFRNKHARYNIPVDVF
jgi:hypothetical protein